MLIKAMMITKGKIKNDDNGDNDDDTHDNANESDDNDDTNQVSESDDINNGSTTNVNDDNAKFLCAACILIKEIEV